MAVAPVCQDAGGHRDWRPHVGEPAPLLDVQLDERRK
jgi:hypothetical protein